MGIMFENLSSWNADKGLQCIYTHIHAINFIFISEAQKEKKTMANRICAGKKDRFSLFTFVCPVK